MYSRKSSSAKFFVLTFFFAILPFSFLFYSLNKKVKGLTNYLELLVRQKDVDVKEEIEKAKAKSLPDNSLKAKTWLDVQKKVSNTVVQVFTQVDNFNWFEPYKAPKQGAGSGSGFFIDEKGYIVTNYHVISQASSVKIQVPYFGRKQFDVDVVGVCPDRDIALLKLTKDSFDILSSGLGKISYLDLGDSDSIVRTQEVLALGYPLSQERLKSTLGIVSGRERAGFVQITAALNPGNSGGPCLGSDGKVVGINFAIIAGAQNVGYFIPINEVKSSLKDMRKVKLLRKPTLGCIFTIATPETVEYLGNPKGGGWYIAEVFENTILDEIGIKEDDMLYEVNGYRVDLYGEIYVPWSEDKISLLDFFNRFTVGDDIHFVIYRRGVRKDFRFKLSNDYLPPIRKIYYEFEPDAIDYEVFGGMVVMQLTLNHVAHLLDRIPSMTKYIRRPELQHKPVLLITHVLPNSQAQKARVLSPGATIDEINDNKVTTLQELREEIKKMKKDDFLTIKTNDKMFAALSFEKILKDEDLLSSRYFYKKSKLLDHFKEQE